MRILFITSTRLGDAVLSTGLLGHLIETCPQARLTIACGALPAPLFARLPGLTRLHVLTKRRYAGHWVALWRACVGQRWDLVVDLRNSAVSRLLWCGRLALQPASRPGRHRVEQIGLALGLDPPPAPRLWLSETDRQASAGLVPPGDTPVLGIGPAANWAGKTWPGDRFVALVERLTASAGPLPGARVAVFAAANERDRVAAVLAALPAGQRLDLIGQGDPALAAACLARCTAFVGNDSGLMHMAAAVGVPTLGLFGPSRLDHYRPWGPHTAAVGTAIPYEELVARPGFRFDAPACYMDSLSVDSAFQAACRLLERTGITAAGSSPSGPGPSGTRFPPDGA